MIYVLIPTTAERRERLQKCLDALRRSTVPHCVVIYENSDGGCVLAQRRALAGLNGLIFILNDDMIVEPDCLSRLLESYLHHFPRHDGICQPDDNYHTGNLATAPFGHSETLRPFLQDYMHYFWDTELTTVMQRAGRYVTVLAAKLDHQHHTKGRAPLDQTYQQTGKNFERDREVFRQREAAGFPNRGTR